MKRLSLLYLFIFLSKANFGQIIADHTVVDRYDDIPQYYIDQVRKMWLVVAGESHSQGYMSGMVDLEAVNPVYNVNYTYQGTPEAYTTAHLRISRSTWGDLNNATGWIYSYGEEDWFTSALAISRTKAGISYCHDNNPEISAIGFGWCYDGGYTDMTAYLNATQAYIDYCKANGYNTKVFFTTGPVDDWNARADETSYLKSLAYKSIRDYVAADGTRILFDFADILCYDSGSETPNTQTWNGHTFPVITTNNLIPTEGSHISNAGELRLAKAMWWMLARIAGWDGGVITGDNSSIEKSKTSAFIERSEDEIRIRFDDVWLNSTVSLLNLHGSVLEIRKADGNLCVFNTSHLTPGIYLLKISNSKTLDTKKIIIQ